MGCTPRISQAFGRPRLENFELEAAWATYGGGGVNQETEVYLCGRILDKRTQGAQGFSSPTQKGRENSIVILLTNSVT